MAAFLEADHLTFDYLKQDGGIVRAIDDISFRVEKGSFTAIIGQNGSGKSTLAKNINALLPFRYDIKSDTLSFGGIATYICI